MARPSKNEKLSPLTSGLGGGRFAELIAKKSNSYTLRSLRKSKGYTLADVAALTGLSPSYVSRLEAGDRRYNSDVLAKLAAVLGCSEYDLLKKSDDNTMPVVKETTYVPQKDLPVYRMVAGSVIPNGKETDYPMGDFEAPESRIFRLPQLVGIKSAFAFHIVDNINAPKYRRGDIVFVNTDKPIARGCPVALITLNHQVVIGELINWNDEAVEVCHFGRTNSVTFAKKSLQATYAIIGSFDYYQGNQESGR